MGNAPSEVGRVLAGRYRLEKRLGVGGMGSIWRAEHLVLRAPVAIKLIDPEIADNDEALDRFMREAQAAAALRSPHVVQILDYGVDDRSPFIVMELLDGENLAQRLARVGRLSALETARIVTHVARAVGRAHEAGIIHRDLKPDNIFLVRNEDVEIAKVVDFGVAKVDPSTLGPGATRTRTGSLLGTPYYMSPEQAQGNKEVDYRSDLWALGVIAFECMTGKRPFDSDGLGDLVLQICVREIPVPSTIVPVPEGFDTWFLRATNRDPAARFQSAREMADAVRGAMGSEAREAILTVPDDQPEGGSLKATQPKSVAGIAGSSREPPTERVNPAPSPAFEGVPAPRREDPHAPTVRAENAESASTPAAHADHAANMRPALILAVAGGALVIGLIGGLIVLGRTNSAPLDLPDGGDSAGVVADSGVPGAVASAGAPARHNVPGRTASSEGRIARIEDGGFDVRAWMFGESDAGPVRDASTVSSRRDAASPHGRGREGGAGRPVPRAVHREASAPPTRTPPSSGGSGTPP